MCQTCTAAERRLLLAEATEQLILAEADAGYSVMFADRPLTAAERRARTRFGAIDNLMNGAVDDAAEVLERLVMAINDTISAAVYGRDRQTVAPSVIARALAALNAEQPRAIQQAVAAAAVDLRDVLRGVYTGASQLALDEAREQGSLPARRAAPLEAPAEDFAAAAAAAAMYPWMRTTSKLQADLLAPGRLAGPDMAREAFESQLRGIPIEGAVDTARQGIHQAHGRGRVETASSLGPTEIWASELLDNATCRPCERIDGHEYDTLEQARKDYPHGGYYACDGDARCRGTLVFIYPEGEDAPPPPPDRTPPPEPKPSPPIAPAPPPPPAPATPAGPQAPTGTPPKRKKNQPQRYERVDQLPLKPADAPKLSPLEEAVLMNPEHDPTYSTKVYNMNCTSVVTAYELRRRGYDVTAAPVPGGRGRYHHQYLPFWRDPATGDPPKYTAVADKAAMDAAIRALPDGARGTIKCVWAAGDGAHVFNFEKVNGEPVYVEGQNPKRPDASTHFDKVMPGTLGFFRTDNLVPHDMGMVAVQTRTPEYLADLAAQREREYQKKWTEGRYMLNEATGKFEWHPPRFRKEGRKYVRLRFSEREAIKREREERMKNQ